MLAGTMNGKEAVQEPDTLLPPPSSATAGQGPERARPSGLELKRPHCYERRRLRESKGSKWSVDEREGSHLKKKELRRKQLKKMEGRLLLAINGEEMRVQKGHIPALEQKRGTLASHLCLPLHWPTTKATSP